MKKLSLIIPVYFNAKNLPVTYAKLCQQVLNELELDYELIFVDDGSGDNSWQVLQELKQKNPKIKLVKLSRNFGSHAAILAGLTQAQGDAATVISADLQDPPEIIKQMLTQWQAGYKVVLAVRADRQESFFQKFFSNSYYNLMRRFARPNMPRGGFECFLIDRQVINVITQIEEKNSTLMGQILWCGFKTTVISYTRQARTIGKSRWTLSKKIKLFIDSFTAFSYFPIRLMSALGFFVALIAFCYGIFILVSRIFFSIPVPGFTTLAILILFLSGLQMLMLGIIGEYLWRSFDESRRRPPFIIDDKC
jgi:dolichol-phosphate mannosyltransferase